MTHKHTMKLKKKKLESSVADFIIVQKKKNGLKTTSTKVLF